MFFSALIDHDSGQTHAKKKEEKEWTYKNPDVTLYIETKRRVQTRGESTLQFPETWGAQSETEVDPRDVKTKARL